MPPRAGALSPPTSARREPRAGSVGPGSSKRFPPAARALAVFLALAAVYFAVGTLSLALGAFEHPSASAIWPPTGIALASLLLLGLRFWPAILAAAFLVNLRTGPEELGLVKAIVALEIAVGNTLEAVAGAWLVGRFARGRLAFERPQTVFLYALLAGVVATLISATIGPLSVTLGSKDPPASFGVIWLTWWLGDAGGALIVAPVILLWSRPWRENWSWTRIGEAALLLAMLLAASSLTFGLWPLEHKNPVAFAILPFLVWVAFRFGPREASAAILVIAVIAVAGSLRGFGPFARERPNEALLLLQAFLITISVTTLALSASVSERRRAFAELAESEKRLEALFEQDVVCVAQLELDGGLAAVNERFCALAERPRTELLGLRLQDLVHPDDVPALERTLEQLRHEGRGNVIEQRWRRPGASDAWVNCSLSAVTDARGRPRYALALAQDIGERKRAEEDLRKQAAELARSNAELERFAYVASHDLQEPLRTVSNFTQIAARRYSDRLDPEGVHLLEFAREGAERMQMLLRDLLLYARVGHERELEDVDLGEGLRDALGNLSRAVEESGARVTSDVLPRVHANPSNVVRLFQNLVGNAIKFRGADPPRVHVSSARIDGAWLLGVQDNGIGIAPEYHEQVFTIFQRLHARSEYPGTGVGLAICKKIVEQLGGRIWVESEPGQGSRFFFTLPDSEPTGARE
ncbi:MAG TPA: MASE1 domain-containing protein [Planctomycetota bacterium]|nr:MASE1 domain-containing protein [Planctomycetota bacterium]